MSSKETNVEVDEDIKMGESSHAGGNGATCEGSTRLKGGEERNYGEEGEMAENEIGKVVANYDDKVAEDMLGW